MNRSLNEHLQQFAGQPVIFFAVEHICEVLPNLVFEHMKLAAKKHESQSDMSSAAQSSSRGNLDRRGRGRGRRGGRKGGGGQRESAPKPIVLSDDVKRRIASLQTVRRVLLVRFAEVNLDPRRAKLLQILQQRINMVYLRKRTGRVLAGEARCQTLLH